MFRKSLAVLAIILTLHLGYVRSSEAFVPVAIGAGALAVGGALITIGAITYYRPTALPPSWTSSDMLTTAGNIGRVAIAGYDSWTQYNTSQMIGNIVAFKADCAALANKFLNDSSAASAYPALSSFVTASDGAPLITLQNAHAGGTYTTPDGKTILLTQFEDSGTYSGTLLPTYYVTNGTTSNPQEIRLSFNNGNGTYGYAHYRVALTSPPPPRARTTAEIKALAPNNVIPSGAADDLDRLIAANANGYGVSVVDVANPTGVDNAPPFIPPYVAPAPVDGAAPTVQPGTTAAGSTNNAAAQTAAQNATSAASAAHAAVNNYMSSHPTATAANDPTLADLIAQAAQADIVSQAATQAATNADQAAKEVYQNAAADSPHSIDFSPFLGLKYAFSNVWPFSLLPLLTGLFSSIVSSPVAPTFDLPLPLGKTVHIDLAIFDPVAAVLRWIIALCLTIAAYLGMIRYWRGVS